MSWITSDRLLDFWYIKFMLLQNRSVISKVLDVHSTLVLDKFAGYTPEAQEVIGRDNTRTLPGRPEINFRTVLSTLIFSGFIYFNHLIWPWIGLDDETNLSDMHNVLGWQVWDPKCVNWGKHIDLNSAIYVRLSSCSVPTIMLSEVLTSIYFVGCWSDEGSFW